MPTYIMTETSCFEISELIKAQNRWEAWKYYLINELEVLDFDNRRKQKGYMWNCDFDIFTIHDFKIHIHHNYVEFIIGPNADADNTMSHKITVKQSFSNFCQENFNETNHIKWTYEEIDKYFTKLQLHFYDDQVVEYNAVSGTHIWFWNLIEVDEELLTDENKYISIARKNDGHTNIVTQDDVKVETYKTNIYANVPYGTQNRKHLYEIGNLDIIEKPQFVAEYQKQQASAILIQNAWIDAIVNPNCVLGINRINKDFDDMQSGTL